MKSLTNTLKLFAFFIVTSTIQAQPCLKIFPAQSPSAQVGDTISIDYLVANFNEVISMQFELNWDTSSLEFIDVQTFNLPGFDQNHFGIQYTSQGILPGSWFEPNVSGISLNNSTKIFQLSFVVLSNASCNETIFFPEGPDAQFPPEFGDANGLILCHELKPVSILTQNNSALIQSITPDTTLCGGGQFQLHLDAPKATKIHWLPQGNLSCFDCPNPFASVAFSQEFYVTVEDSLGCTEQGQVFVDVHFGLDWGLLPFSNSPVCAGENLLFFEELHFDIVSYEWAGANGFTSTDEKPIIANSDFSDEGIYTAVFTDEFGCQGVTDIFVEVLDCPQIINAIVTDVDCPGEENGSIEISITGGSGNFDIQWTGPVPGLPSSTSLNNLQVGIYEVTIFDNVNGTTAYSIFNVNVSPNAPVADAGPDLALNCLDTVLTLMGNANVGPNYSYFWTTLNGHIIDLDLTLHPLVDAPGTYTLTVVDATNGCSSSSNMIVTEDTNIPNIPPLPDIYFCEGESFQIDLSWLNAMTYEWVPALGINDPNIPNVIIIPPSNLTYTIHLTFPNHCMDSTSFTLFHDLDCPWINQDTISHNSEGVDFELSQFLKKSTVEREFWSNEKQKPNFEIEVHPNPASEIIILKYQNVLLEKIEWFSLEGKLIETTQLTENQSIINTHRFNRGIFLMKICTNKGVIKKRLLILK